MVTKKRPGRPGLSSGHVRRVRSALRKFVKTHPSAASAARALGLSPSAISQILSQKNAPSLATAMSLATAQGVALSALLGEA